LRPDLAVSRLDAFEQRLQAGPIHPAGAALRPVRHEPAVFEPLGPRTETAPVPVHHLDLGAGPVDEGIQALNGEGIPFLKGDPATGQAWAPL
jgi:hypothetical protein